MKLVIDISKEMYQECIETVASSTAHYESYEFHRMVQNGTLFDSVLEDIKADIAEEICLTNNPYTEQTEYTISHKKVLKIIDKRKGVKNEVN